jgi:predicted RNA binding protein YcfA (HicA-like mRNA interferase family)
MRPQRLLKRIASNAFTNVSFGDLVRLLGALGFHRIRTSGSHHIYAHSEIPRLVNLQDARGQAKPYQVRQVGRLVERYNLRLKRDREDGS